MRSARVGGVGRGRNLTIIRKAPDNEAPRAGGWAKAIQELAGHTDLTTTMRYMHLSPASLHEAIGLLNDREEPAGNQEGTKAPPENKTK